MKHRTSPRFRSRRLALIAGLGLAAGLATVVLAPREAEARRLPTAVRANETVVAEIDRPAETDDFEVYLFPGEELRVQVRAQGPIFGLLLNPTLLRPNGQTAAATISGGNTERASLTYVAAERGLHVLRVAGGPGQFSGATGNYQATFAVSRLKPPKTTYSDPAGGAIAIDFGVTDGARVTVTAKTKKGTFALTELRRPDGTAEPAFAAALKAATNGRSAKAKKVLPAGGPGTYRLVGTYAAGATPTIVVKVAHDEPKRRRSLGIEPDLHPSILPTPSEAVAGVTMQVVANDFTYAEATKKKPAVLPRIFVGPVEVPRDSILHPNGILWVFPIPAGLAPGQTYDVRMVNADGQAAVADDALTIVPPPVIVGFTGTSGGPAGGRSVRITGANLRSGSVVLFGTRVSDPSITLPTRIDVKSPSLLGGSEPPTLPQSVQITVRDEFGQTATTTQQFTYLDVPSNAIESIDRPFLQSLGGETVTVTGTGFVASSVLEIDDAEIASTRDSATQMTFVAPPRPDGTATLRVTDEYEQSSVLPVVYEGFTDATALAVPGPLTTAGQVDGWRATRLLRGDVSGDGVADFVLLRNAPASGSSSGRSRVRVFRTQTANGALEDRTGTAIPAVSGDEDWRAADGVLADLDGDGDLDLAIVAPDEVSGGTRSSLRILRNGGSGTFTDVTSSTVPASTSWGDRNQGVAIVAADVDGADGLDLVIGHTAGFYERIETETDPGDPGADPPVPPTIEVTENYYPALRVLLNDGSGGFTRSLASAPSVDGTEVHQFEADALVAGDVDGDGDADLLLTRHIVTENPAGTFHRTAVLLRNGSGTLADASSSLLPAPSGAEHLQGDRLVLTDADGDTDLDLLVSSTTVLVDPATGATSSASALRLFTNASGTFTAAAAGTFPASDRADQNQCDGFAIGDLSGDGRPEIVLVSARAPNAGDRGGRILVADGTGAWTRGSAALPNPLSADDARGADVALSDVDADGDLDLVIVRDDPDETVRNTRVLRNPRK